MKEGTRLARRFLDGGALLCTYIKLVIFISMEKNSSNPPVGESKQSSQDYNNGSNNYLHLLYSHMLLKICARVIHNNHLYCYRSIHVQYIYMYTCVVMNTCIYNIPVDALIPIKKYFTHLQIHVFKLDGGFFFGGGGVLHEKYLTKN